MITPTIKCYCCSEIIGTTYLVMQLETTSNQTDSRLHARHKHANDDYYDSISLFGKVQRKLATRLSKCLSCPFLPTLQHVVPRPRPILVATSVTTGGKPQHHPQNVRASIRLMHSHVLTAISIDINQPRRYASAVASYDNCATVSMKNCLRLLSRD